MIYRHLRILHPGILHTRILSALALVVFLFAGNSPSSAFDPVEIRSSSTSAYSAEFEFELHHVRLRPGVRTRLGVRVFGNAFSGSCQLAVHGFMHTAASWRPYAEALGDACVIALDMPGRGGSSLPTGISYSEMSLDDQVTAVRKALRRLDWFFGIDTLVGHSQGALLIQRLQQWYVDRGWDLDRRFGIEEVILLAPAHPAEVPSILMDSGAALEVLQAFLGEDPTLGTVVSIPAAFFPAVFFADPSGTIAPGSPTGEAIEAQGFNAPADPLVASLELSGSLGFTRPSVAAGIFGPTTGTRLRLVTHSEDAFFPPVENLDLYEYLTGDTAERCAAVSQGPDTIHDLYVLNPGVIVNALDSLETCTYAP